MLWSKQLYYYDVARWLDGDPTQPPPPASRPRGPQRRAGGTFDAFDIMSMPDKWEYPWFAAWDLAFHCVALAHVDPAFAKYQLILLCREWFQHPNGALPAYEWSFDDVNPPVQAWAALRCSPSTAAATSTFLSRVFDKLLVNFTWWVNREDADGSNVFEGGFLGLDNIGPIDRSHLPAGLHARAGRRDRLDGVLRAEHGRDRRGPATDRGRPGDRPRAQVPRALRADLRGDREQGLWDEEDGFYYDQLRRPDGAVVPIKVRSMVGILPLLAVAVVDEDGRRARRIVGQARSPSCSSGTSSSAAAAETRAANGRVLVGAVGVERVLRVFRRLFDEDAFLSPYGLRAVSRYHAEHPFGSRSAACDATIDYEPAESTTGMFGGNSNWRGPIWFPVNYLVVDALVPLRALLRRRGRRSSTRPARAIERTLAEIGEDIRRRLISLFLVGEDGRRPCFGWVERLQTDPAWKDNVLFSEYFHGDNGAGLGASHQTGWTGIVARHDPARSRGVDVPTLGELLARMHDDEAG